MPSSGTVWMDGMMKLKTKASRLFLFQKETEKLGFERANQARIRCSRWTNFGVMSATLWLMMRMGAHFRILLKRNRVICLRFPVTNI